MATDRFGPKHDTDRKSDQNQKVMDFSPTSAAEQYQRNGFLKTDAPCGSDGEVIPPRCYYPLSGTAAEGNLSATHPAWEQA
jgi:hypothetical protein